MPKRSKLLNDNVYNSAISALKDIGETGEIANKLKAIIAAKKYGIKHVSEVFCVNQMSIISWIKKLSCGVSNLTKAPKKSRMPLLNNEQYNIIYKWVECNPNLTINAIKLRILKEFGIEISKSTVHRVLKKFKFSHITPRPKHYKQNAEKVSEFKDFLGKKNKR